jgi:hypothetical protein
MMPPPPTPPIYRFLYDTEEEALQADRWGTYRMIGPRAPNSGQQDIIYSLEKFDNSDGEWKPYVGDVTPQYVMVTPAPGVSFIGVGLVGVFGSPLGGVTVATPIRLRAFIGINIELLITLQPANY